MFERFTDRARRVVVLAEEEARMLDHNYIGTEHILLGLIGEGEGVAAKALESLGISLDVVRQQIEEIIGQGQQAPPDSIPFTPRAKKVFELSLRESLQLGHQYVGTEHILLALIREGDGVAAQVLVKLGADLNRVRQQVGQQVGQLLHGYQDKESASAGAGEGFQLGQRASARPQEDAPTRIELLDRRLAAIERWVGLRPDLDDLDQEIAQVCREKEGAADRQDFEVAAELRDKEQQLRAARADREKDWTEAAADRRSLVTEFGRLNDGLDRLRAVLREHGIEPGGDGA
jgi:ATP-dependent Clp protease ATP-binding subunit ClpC